MKPWVPEGSFFSPDDFQSRLRSCGGRRSFPSTRGDARPSPSARAPVRISSIPASASELSIVLGDISHVADVSISVVSEDGVDVAKAVPTIMISNSTVALPLSLESSQSLQAVVPLAVRRGKSPPRALVLDKTERLDSYPAVASSFLDSPTAESPTFKFSSGTSNTSLMTLEAMCNDLRSKCPELTVAPSLDQADAGHKNKAITEATVVPITREVKSIIPDIPQDVIQDGDEWAFAQDILSHFDKLHNGVVIATDASHCSSADILPAVPEDTESAEMDSFSWASTPTFIDSSQDDSQTMILDRIDNMKLQRRKTVIIETSDIKQKLSDTVNENERRSIATSGQKKDEKSISFESPEPLRSRTQSAPAPSRPISSATTKPVRGILKGSRKKCVRFSSSDPTRPFEYPGQENLQSPPGSSPGTPTNATTFFRKGSPLRHSFLPDSPIASSTEDSSIESPTSRLPKHPAARAIAFNTITFSPTSGTRSGPQTPVPAFLIDQRRAPLRSINGRQNLPVERDSKAIMESMTMSPPPPSRPLSPPSAPLRRGGSIQRKPILKEDISKPKRLMKAASASIPAPHQIPTHSSVSRRRASEGASPSPSQKGRIRSILTKLKA